MNDLILQTNKELIKLQDWTIMNRFTINDNKTEILLFTNRDHNINSP